MFLPRDIRNLARRIEKLQRVRPHDWLPGDAITLRNLLPGGRGRQHLPEPVDLMQLAEDMGRGEVSKDDRQKLARNWRNWMAWVARGEGLIRDNDPRRFNPRRMIRDMQRGKWPH